jgi:hypothetical protein
MTFLAWECNLKESITNHADGARDSRSDCLTHSTTTLNPKFLLGIWLMIVTSVVAPVLGQKLELWLRKFVDERPIQTLQLCCTILWVLAPGNTMRSCMIRLASCLRSCLCWIRWTSAWLVLLSRTATFPFTWSVGRSVSLKGFCCPLRIYHRQILRLKLLYWHLHKFK